MARINEGPVASLSPRINSLRDGAGTTRTGRSNLTLLMAGGLQAEDSGASSPATIKKTISERRLQANRLNAAKSTGPRSARGKAFSRLNATKHGLHSKAVLFGSDGTPADPELRAAWESLRAEYGQEDGCTDAVIRSVVVEWAHQRRAIELETSYLENALDDSTSPLSLSNLLRYGTTSQRSLRKNLAQLRTKARGPFE